MRCQHDPRRYLPVLSLLLVCASTGEAQTSQLTQGRDRLIAQHYRNSSGEKGLTTYEYDHNGLMHRARWGLLDGSRHSQNYHTFDGDGNWTRKYREFSDGLTSDVVYEYDDGGRLVGERISRSDGVSGKTTYGYDEEGRLERANCDRLNTWFTGTLVYEHDEEGRLSGALILKDGQQVGTIAYEHDDRDNLIEEHWDFGGRWDQTSTYEYEPFEARTPPSYASTNVFVVNTADYRVVGESYDFDGSMSGECTWDYEEDGKLVGKGYRTSEGLGTDTTLEYDDAGRLTRTTRKYSNGLTAVFTYRFNGNRRLVHRAYERSDGVTGSEDYEYDAKMRLTRAVYDNFDTWITGTITFQHADDGGLEEGRFDGDRFDAEINFTRDGNGNVTRIHWDFDFGKTQTYTLRYEENELGSKLEKPS